MRNWWSGLRREYKLLLLSWLFFGITSGIYDPIFNNYLSEVFHISAKVRGFLEFPREFPGFMVALISGFLMFMADVQIFAMAISLVAVGLLGQSFSDWGGQPHMTWMIVSMLIWSVGTHLYLPLSSSVSVNLSPKENVGRSLGLLSGVNTAAYIIGLALVYVVMGQWHFQYNTMFRLGMVCALIAAGCLFLIKVSGGLKPSRPKLHLVFRKEYSLFYGLSVLYGARKQVFLTFAPWVLIKLYGQKETTFVVLLFIASLIGIVFKPWLGRMIDKVGERPILMGEALSLVMICLGYGFAGYLNLGKYAIYLVYLCFIVDQVLFAVSMARTTYLHKRLVCESDFTPTLSLGVSIDHIVAMSIPALGGILWERFGFETIFALAAGIAVVNLWAAAKVKAPPINSPEASSDATPLASP
jgi:predicted MFS family arabinose efflux permease